MAETIKQLTNQLMEINATSADIVKLDTRTPPKIKQQLKNRNKTAEKFENSHAGVAIPVDEDEFSLDGTTKKLDFNKIESSTTNGGLSTWILLSGQTTASIPKPPRKAIVKPNEDKNITLVVDQDRIIKPIFKKRIVTTKKPLTTSTTTAGTTITTTPLTYFAKVTSKLSKVNGSALNGNTTIPTTISDNTKKKPLKTFNSVKSTTASPNTSSTVDNKSTTNTILVSTSATGTNSSSLLRPEAKEGEADLTEASNKKNKTSSAKRKKNKKRRRPASDKNGSNSTKIDKHQINKGKPLGTQLYNYLSREVMPTVGVGLVGLMVTAGLASYFLYPFSPVRRSYDVDRRDKEGSFYYNDEFSGGISEEEAIGKVIAGMPSKSLYEHTFNPSRNSVTTPNRQVKNRMSQSAMDYHHQNNYDYRGVLFNQQGSTINRSHENNYNTMKDHNKYVVANVPDEEVTPAAVPEHGPRSIRLRRKRRVQTKEGEK